MAAETPSNNYPLVIKQNATFTRTWTLRNANGSPQNITGYKARMIIQATGTTGNPTLELSTDNGKIIIDGPNGKITTRLEWTETKNLTWRNGNYDLLVRKNDGPPATILDFAEGTVTTLPGVTNIPANW